MSDTYNIINDGDNNGYANFTAELEALLHKYQSSIYSPFGSIVLNIQGQLFRPFHAEQNRFIDHFPRLSGDLVLRHIGSANELDTELDKEQKDLSTPSPMDTEYE